MTLHRLVAATTRRRPRRAPCLDASSRSASSTRLVVCGGWRWSGRPAAASRCSRRRRRDGWPRRAIGRSSSASTSGSRRADPRAASARGARRPALTVTTFHRLCETLAAAAGVLPARPSPIPQDWWDETLPAALEAAIERCPTSDSTRSSSTRARTSPADWLETLDLLLHAPGEDVLWVFHDPGQALYRDDRRGQLGLERLELLENRRNPGRSPSSRPVLPRRASRSPRCASGGVAQRHRGRGRARRRSRRCAGSSTT